MANEVEIQLEFTPQYLDIPTEGHQLPFGFASSSLRLIIDSSRIKPVPLQNQKMIGLMSISLVFSIILTIYYTYIFVISTQKHIIPLMELSSTGLTLRFWKAEDPDYLQAYLELVIFNFLSWMLVISLLRAMFTPPGTISNDLALELEYREGSRQYVLLGESLINRIKSKGYVEKKQSSLPRYCKSCIVLKPDRSHHCKFCKRCVLKMDHHCPYLNNCVGLHNYKFFMNSLIYGVLCGLMVSMTMWKGMIKIWEDSSKDLLEQVMVGNIYFGQLILNLVLIIFFLFHCYLIYNNLTTIEFREKLEVKFDKSPYSTTAYGNFVSIFGHNPLKWFLPFSAEQDTDLTFRITEEEGQRKH